MLKSNQNQIYYYIDITVFRKQMQDLDDITNKFRAKLSCQTRSNDANHIPEFQFPVTSQSGQYPLTSTQTSLILSNLPRSQNETPRDDLAYTGSHGAESSRTGADSGAFSAEQTTDKYEDSAPTSQRSTSDRLDTLRSGVTPRDFLDSGINHTNNDSHYDEHEQNIWLTITPRDSDERKDEYSESGGFSYRHSSRDPLHTPRDLRTSSRELEELLNVNKSNGSINGTNGKTLNQHKSSGSTYTTNGKTASVDDKISKSDQKQMSIIQEYSENDKSVSEDEDGENKYYHRYRDLLDKEDNDDDDDNDEEEEEGEIIVPRRINDVSGKFSPTGEIIMLSDDITSSVPYGFTARPSHEENYNNSNGQEEPRSAPNSARNVKSPQETEDILQDVDSDLEAEFEPRERDEARMENQEEVIFNERDSWLSDSDKEPEHEEHSVGYRYLQNRGHLAKHKHQRQDSDTGYSSRDNVSESYLTPSAGGTNSETDISRLHEHEHWDHRESDYHVFPSDRHRNRLLANVELESTGGSFGLKYDSGHSRISSAGSRQTRKSSEPSVTESFDEKEENEYRIQELEPIESARESQLASARTDELEDFFGGETNSKPRNPAGRARSESESSDNSDIIDNRKRTHSKGEHISDFKAQFHRNVDSDNEESDEKDSRVTPRHSPRQIQQSKVTPRQGQGALGGKQGTVPNFFMPVHHLEESLRTLQVVTNKVRVTSNCTLL